MHYKYGNTNKKDVGLPCRKLSSRPVGVALESVVRSNLCLISVCCSSSFARRRKCPPWCHCRSSEVEYLEEKNQTMSGYTPDEKLRVEQITTLRRRWLKDQELSPREPVLQAKPLGAVAKFWAGFLEPKSLWRLYVSPGTQIKRASWQNYHRCRLNTRKLSGNTIYIV